MANSISKEEIQKLLPHREPMLLIDRLTNIVLKNIIDCIFWFLLLIYKTHVVGCLYVCFIECGFSQLDVHFLHHEHIEGKSIFAYVERYF